MQCTGIIAVEYGVRCQTLPHALLDKLHVIEEPTDAQQ